MVTFGHVVIDCYDAPALAEWWAAALRTTVVYDWEDYVVIDGAPRIAFQGVPEPTPGKNRLHFDLLTDDLDGESQRLIGLGASLIEHIHMRGGDWNVLADPEGNEFCLAEPFDLQFTRKDPESAP